MRGTAHPYSQILKFCGQGEYLVFNSNNATSTDFIPNYTCSACVLVLVCLCSRAYACVLVPVCLCSSCLCCHVLVLVCLCLHVCFLVCLCARPIRPSRPSRPQ